MLNGYSNAVAGNLKGLAICNDAALLIIILVLFLLILSDISVNVKKVCFYDIITK